MEDARCEYHNLCNKTPRTPSSCIPTLRVANNSCCKDSAKPCRPTDVSFALADMPALTNPNIKQSGQRIWLRLLCAKYSLLPSWESWSIPVKTGMREKMRPANTAMAHNSFRIVGRLRSRISLQEMAPIIDTSLALIRGKMRSKFYIV